MGVETLISIEAVRPSQLTCLRSVDPSKVEPGVGYNSEPCEIEVEKNRFYPNNSPLRIEKILTMVHSCVDDWGRGSFEIRLRI
jgi:hypothetical protein